MVSRSPSGGQTSVASMLPHVVRCRDSPCRKSLERHAGTRLICVSARLTTHAQSYRQNHLGVCGVHAGAIFPKSLATFTTHHECICVDDGTHTSPVHSSVTQSLPRYE